MPQSAPQGAGQTGAQVQTAPALTPPANSAPALTAPQAVPALPAENRQNGALRAPAARPGGQQ